MPSWATGNYYSNNTAAGNYYWTTTSTTTSPTYVFSTNPVKYKTVFPEYVKPKPEPEPASEKELHDFLFGGE